MVRTYQMGTKNPLSAYGTQQNITISVFNTVLNHKANAEHTEWYQVVEASPEDRKEVISEPYEIEAWLSFAFATRGDTYSQMKSHWYHLGIDYNQEDQKKAIYKITGDNEEKEWCQYVDTSGLGNYDYLMFANIDYSNPNFRNDMENWGIWVARGLGLGEFRWNIPLHIISASANHFSTRFDAVRHLSSEFLKEFIDHLDKTLGEDWFFVGEY
ncbi:unnamed protein product [Tuber aestivum]|uniref:Uncharacterized protein n=1 Tax=Tuber aestivum TaxID=59557 RepID=A0A292PXA6_9PEZI|nr:unnamed protein product [Tuber aestivum]